MYAALPMRSRETYRYTLKFLEINSQVNRKLILQYNLTIIWVRQQPLGSVVLDYNLRHAHPLAVINWLILETNKHGAGHSKYSKWRARRSKAE